MGIQMIQTCEMCGQKRNLPTNNGHPRTPQPDCGGWRLLSHGAREATLCDKCILIVVHHAIERAQARREGTPGSRNDKPLTIHFNEANKEDQ